MRMEISNISNFLSILKRGIFFSLILFLLTACTGREDIVLEPDGQAVENVEESLGTEEPFLTGAAAFAESGSGQLSKAETSAIGSGEAQQTDTQTDTVSESVSDEIYVHICGAVVKPGVYQLAAGSRVFEGIAAAGGFREDACEDFINQAKPLQDGQRLMIPTEEEAETAKSNDSYLEVWLAGAESMESSENTETATVGEAALVNINTASIKELTDINGIGEGKAAAIVQYRQENGNFASKEDIMKVSGIGEGTYEKIKDRITVN